MDPLQFAYQPDIGVDNAIIFLLDRSLSHLEKPRSTVRIMFSYFSSAFNTIQPAILRDKLKLTGLDQYLKVLGPRLPRQLATVCEDSGLHVGHNICRTGYKPPTEKSPGPFPVHPVHCRLLPPITPQPSTKVHWRLCYHQPHQGGDDKAYRELIKGFGDWCQRNHLQLNAEKTKELVVDFHRHKQPCIQVNTQGTDIEKATSYKYLGVHMNNKLDWTEYIRKVRAASICCGSSCPLECRGHSWLLSKTLWWHQAFSME